MKTLLRVLSVVALLVAGSSTSFAQNSQDVKYQGEFNVAYAIPATDDIKNPLNLEMIHGIRVNPNIAVGLGLGVNFYEKMDIVLVPLFVDVKWYILNGKISPYVALDMGYSFGTSGDIGDESGMYIAPGVGVSFKMKEKGAFNLGLALKDNGVGSGVSVNSLAIKAAIVF